MNGTTIYHVQFRDAGESHHYFGSISAIYDTFTPEQLGVAKSTLWGYGITRVHPYENRKCIIRKGELHRKKGNRKGG
jgi:hypothetical protein